MVEYTKIDTKLSNLQLNKFKKATKNNEGLILRIGVKKKFRYFVKRSY